MSDSSTTSMQANDQLRVIKLGGSLLAVPDLRHRFHAWLRTQPPCRNLLVTGGGQTVESIRELDETHRLPSKLTHWLCVDLMSTTARLANEILEIERIVSTPEELLTFLNLPFDGSIVACVQPAAYYTPSIANRSNCSLPESWDCTSDSLAAWLANSLAAEELVLLKSIENEYSPTRKLSEEAIRGLAERKAVDRAFPETSRSLGCVRIVNLREWV